MKLRRARQMASLVFVGLLGSMSLLHSCSVHKSQDAKSVSGQLASVRSSTTENRISLKSSNSVQLIIDDMNLQADTHVKNWDEAAVSGLGSAAAISDQIQKGLLPQRFSYQMNNITPWMWVFEGDENYTSNTAVEVRDIQAYVLADGVWTKVALENGYPVACAEFYDGSGYNTNGCGSSAQKVKQVENNTLQVIPAKRSIAYEIWPASTHLPNIPNALMQKAKAYFVTCEARVVQINPSGPDERSRSRFAAQLGFDLYIRGEGQTQVDGGVGRVKYITSQWQSFNAITTKSLYTGGLAPRYGGTSDYSMPAPYDSPPFAITHSEIRANPPPFGDDLPASVVTPTVKNTSVAAPVVTTPATRNAFVKIQAESFNSQKGLQLVPNAFGYTNSNDYAVYNNVDFGSTGAQSMKFSLGAPASVAGQKFEVRLGSASGELISEVIVKNTGGYAIFQEQIVNLNRTVTGLQTVVLVMRGNDIVDIDSFTFVTAKIANAVVQVPVTVAPVVAPAAVKAPVVAAPVIVTPQISNDLVVCPIISCPAAPAGCSYSSTPVDAKGCAIGCAPLVCEQQNVTRAPASTTFLTMSDVLHMIIWGDYHSDGVPNYVNNIVIPTINKFGGQLSNKNCPFSGIR